MKISRLFDIPYYQLANSPLQECIVGKPGGKLIKYSTKQLVEQAQALSLGLIEIGVKPGDRVATIVYNSRPEWHVLDIALLQIGAVNVPVYPTISPREYVYIFNDASVKFCFVGEGDLLEKVREAQKQVYSLKEIFTFHVHAEATHWASLMRHSTDFTELEALKANVKPTDLATIIYTSGTTGNPKGVMLSHDNICSNVREVVKILPLKSGQQAFSFLPLCHIFERTVTYTYMAVGVKIRYAESIDTLRDELGEVKPHFFSSVPRLLEKVYERIVNTAMSDKPYKRKIFLWAVKLTEKYEIGKELNLMDKIQFVLADKLVFSKIRARLGGNVVGIVTGAAACPRKIAQFFSAAGISIREGYGLGQAQGRAGSTPNAMEPQLHGASAGAKECYRAGPKKRVMCSACSSGCSWLVIFKRMSRRPSTSPASARRVNARLTESSAPTSNMIGASTRPTRSSTTSSVNRCGAPSLFTSLSV